MRVSFTSSPLLIVGMVASVTLAAQTRPTHPPADSVSGALDYDAVVPLDAEDLAEGGIKAAYDSLRPLLLQYLPTLTELSESLDSTTGRYTIRLRGHDYLIVDPSSEASVPEAWGRAAYALFTFVNDQLAGAHVLLYAIDGGNELGGLFLTPAQALAARQTLTRPSDWPYLLTDEPPWFGQSY